MTINTHDDNALRSLLNTQDVPAPHDLEQKIMRKIQTRIQEKNQKSHGVNAGRIWATSFVIAALIAVVVITKPFTLPFTPTPQAEQNQYIASTNTASQVAVDPWLEKNLDPIITQYEAAYYLLEAEEEQEIDRFLDRYMSPNVELL